jgi:hypothetical protein
MTCGSPTTNSFTVAQNPSSFPVPSSLLPSSHFDSSSVRRLASGTRRFSRTALTQIIDDALQVASEDEFDW